MPKLLKNKKQPSNPSRLVLFVLLGWSMLVWSWIFIVDATTLTNATILTYIIRAVVYCVHVGITVLIYYKVSWFFLRKYREADHLSWTFLVKFFVVWAIAEWLVSWLMALVWFGRGASLDSVYPFSSLTPILMYTPLKYLVRVVGFYGLSAVIITIGVCLYARKLRRFAPWLIGLILVLNFASWLFYRSPSGTNIKVVTSSETLSEKPQIKTSAKLAVLPEYGLDNFKPEETEQRITSTNDQEVFYVGSKLSPAPRGLYNTLLFGSTTQGIRYRQNKTRLVAGSEYIPFVVKVPLVLMRQTETLNAFDEVRAIEQGDQHIQPLRISDHIVVGAEVCSSIASPEDYRRLTKAGATLLTNSASLGVFNGSRVYRIEHNGMARFHAVANSRPFVQSALDESSYILDHDGDELATTRPVSATERQITTNSRTTPYTVLGDWPVYVGFAYVVFLIGMVLYKRYSPVS